MSIYYPVRILIDNFQYLGEHIPKGSIFNAFTGWQETFLCDQEGQAERISLEDQIGLVPKHPGSNILVYKERVEVDPPDPKPVRRRPGKPGRTAKVKVKVGAGKYNTQNMTPTDENPGSN